MVELLEQTRSANKRTIISDNEKTCLTLIKVKRSEKRKKKQRSEKKSA